MLSSTQKWCCTLNLVSLFRSLLLRSQFIMFVRIVSLASLCLGVVSSAEIRSWLTTAEVNSGTATNLLVEQSPIYSAKAQLKSGSGAAGVDIDINVDDIKQKILGYGAGLPQASAKVLTDLKTRNIDLYWNVLRKLFSSADGGANINILRFPVGSCDYSMWVTSYDETYNDYNLDHFAIDNDTWLIINILKDLQWLQPNLVLIATPWSAPSWLKEWNSLIAWSNENTLLNTDAAYNTYAQYFAKTIAAFRQQGIAIQYVTLQNEPLFGDSSQYPGMYFESWQAAKLGQLVHKLLGDSVKLLAYDHNWDQPQYPLDVLDWTPRGTFAGTAWHCYGGDMASSMEQMHSRYPDVPQHVTECTGAYPNGVCDISKGMESFGWNHEWDMSNILLGAASHWSSSGVKWIIALDENCGPTLPDVSFTNGRPLVSIPSWATSAGDIHYNQDYYSIKHMSQFLTPQSWNVALNGTDAKPPAKNLTKQQGQGTDQDKKVQGQGNTEGNTVRVGTGFNSWGADLSQLILESFYTAETNTVTVIAMNKDHSNDMYLQVSQGGVWFADTLPKFGTKVYQWQK